MRNLINPAGVDVPTAFFRVLVDEEKGRPRTLAFIMPQTARANEDPNGFLVSVEKSEKATGLDFFTELPKEEERKLEAEKAERMW